MRFSLLSATCVVALWLVLSHVLADTIQRRALVDARNTAQLLSDEVFRPVLQPSDLAGTTMDPVRRRHLDLIVADAKRNGRLVRVKVWSPAGQVVYSDDIGVVGRRYDVEDDLAGAFRGTPWVGISHGEGAEQNHERGLGPLLEAYVPLRFAPGARPAGAFEVYAPYEPVAAAIAEDRRKLFALLAGGLALLWLVLFHIVSGLSRALNVQASTARHEADHDPLTGLPNRRVLCERLDGAIARSARDGTSCALLVIDLDGFKELNDTLGHPAGDALLKDLGPRLRRALGPEGTLARLGGDEFAVLLEDGSDPAEADRVARALQGAMAEPFELDGLRVTVAASTGIARYPEHGADTEALMRRADVAMYQAKRARTGWEEYDLERDGHSRERLALAEELRRGIEGSELEVFYQPQGELQGGRVTGVEALVRWNHPTRGLLPPVEFLPLAEKAGLMRALTARVLDSALAQMAEWERLGLELTVAVNLSIPDLLDARLPTELAARLAASGVDPARLVLEITEDVVMTDPDRCAKVLRQLAGLGVTLALDDFGTGYSSLAHLKALAVDELKIDRSFVTAMMRDPRDAAIVHSTIELARALGLRVVAEGVEDGETWRQLNAYGCDIAQGYFLSRPVPARELTPRLLAALAALEVPVAAPEAPREARLEVPVG